MSDLPAIAIVHYHLRRGGVTRVIQNAVEALNAKEASVVVVTGEQPPAGVSVDAPVIFVDGLGYAEHGYPPGDEALADVVRQKVRAVLGKNPDIWHIHNHSLGKNVAWTRAVAQMAAQGERLVLQIHDFPEDGRPDNYRQLLEAFAEPDDRALGDNLYPHKASVHYALLNKRDYEICLRAGGRADHTHLLPNAVWTGDASVGRTDRRDPKYPLFLYATRAIRRKNMGEFLLWSAMEEGDGRYGITLAPQTKREKPYYERWKDFAADQRLPVDFEMGLQNDFQELLASATALATTSIAEGFGLTFLEPWLAHRPLAGRNLPEITAEFVDEGIDLSGLYSELSVPVSWIDREGMRTKIREALRASRMSYGREASGRDMESAQRSAMTEDRVEFSRLDEFAQESVIRRVCASRDARSEIVPQRLWIDGGSERQVRSNRKRVIKSFGLDQYRKRLMQLYEAALQDGAEPEPLDPEMVLSQFLAPERFYVLRS